MSHSIWSLGDEWHTARSVDWMLVFDGGSRIVLRMKDYSVFADVFRNVSCVKKHVLNKPTDEMDHRPALDLEPHEHILIRSQSQIFEHKQRTAGMLATCSCLAL